jgi:hypothetical protein
MYRDIINAVISTALLGCVLIGYMANAEVDRRESFCLRHTGPQDKPLPTICFVQNETASYSPNGENYVIEVRTSEVEIIKELARSFNEPSCRGEYGAYVTNGRPEAIICRKNMKIFLQEVKRFADASTTNSIDELFSRI